MVKNIIRKCCESGQDVYKALLVHQSTPLETGVSPAQLLMSRPRSS